MEDFIDIYGIESPELEQLDGIADDVFSTNETRRKVIPPPPPADPLQDQSMDVPLEADGSYRLIAFGDRRAWINDGNPQSDAWIAKNSKERQKVSVVIEVTEKLQPSDALAVPTHFQAELLDVTGQIPSRVTLIGSSAGNNSMEVDTIPFQNNFPLPQAVLEMAQGFTWVQYGRCCGVQCEIWRDSTGGINSSKFAFILDLSPLMADTILPLLSNSRRPAIRFRYASGLSQTGWVAWRGWSESIRFTMNSLPPVPYNLRMEPDNVSNV